MNGFLNNLRMKMYHFMQGRYGNDQLNSFLFGASFVFLILSFVFGNVAYIIAIAALAYGYYRFLSKNHSKRYQENIWFINKSKPVKSLMNTLKLKYTYRKTHHVYRCSKCGQNIRIPKGKGKISITCPKCKYEFIKVS